MSGVDISCVPGVISGTLVEGERAQKQNSTPVETIREDSYENASPRFFHGSKMTEDELRSTVMELRSGMEALTQEWGEFLSIEVKKREDDVVERRKREQSESQRAKVEADEWQKRQTFMSKHGLKILTTLFTIASAGLAWYGSQIRGEIQAEQRAAAVDKNIEDNSRDLIEFKIETKNDISELQMDSVNQTIMIADGFERVDKIILASNPKLDDDKLPEPSPEFKEAAKNARKKKLNHEKFGAKP